MNRLLFLSILAGQSLCFALPIIQTTISPTNRYAYSANAGWIDWRGDDYNGVKVTETYLLGYAYAANIGWIHFGDGSPDNGHTYTNASATDYGVNMDVYGSLTGYAYSANVGWIQFEQTYGKPSLYFDGGKFSGYAYSSNIGWISLDTSHSDLTTTLACPDSDGDGIGDAYEMQYWGNLTTATATSDSDGDTHSDAAEYAAATVPTDRASYLRIVEFSQEPDPFIYFFILTYTTVPNRLYTIEASNDLVGPWTALFEGIPTGGYTNTSYIFEFVGTQTRKFYRVVAVKPLQ